MGRHQAPDAPAPDRSPPPFPGPSRARVPVPDEPPTERLGPVRPTSIERVAPPPAAPTGPGGPPPVAATERFEPVRTGPAPAEVLGSGRPVGDTAFLVPRAAALEASRWDPLDEATGTFSGALLSGLGGAPEPPEPPAPPPPRPVATAHRFAGWVAARRGDERTALLAVGAVVGLVLLLLGLFVVVARVTRADPAPAAAPPPATATAAAPTPTAAPSTEPSPTGSPLPPSAGTFTARHSNLCLAVPAGRTEASVQLVQRPCAPDTVFLLVPSPAQPDTYQLVDGQTGRCVDVYGGSQDDGAPIIVFDCHGGPNQAFALRPVTDGAGQPTGYSQLVAQHSGKCLDVVGLGTAEGTPIQQYGCRDAAAESATGNQSWSFSAG